jgi:hypothetical protein
MGEFIQMKSKKEVQNYVQIPWNKKIASVLYLSNLTIFSKNKSVTSFKTLQNGGVRPDEIQKTLKNRP